MWQLYNLERHIIWKYEKTISTMSQITAPTYDAILLTVSHWHPQTTSILLWAWCADRISSRWANHMAPHMVVYYYNAAAVAGSGGWLLADQNCTKASIWHSMHSFSMACFSPHLNPLVYSNAQEQTGLWTPCQFKCILSYTNDLITTYLIGKYSPVLNHLWSSIHECEILLHRQNWRWIDL